MLTYKHISLEHKKAIDGFNCSDEISVELFLKEQALKLHLLRSAVTTIEALPSALSFYEKYGFKVSSRQRGNGELYNMVLKLGELEE